MGHSPKRETLTSGRNVRPKELNLGKFGLIEEGSEGRKSRLGHERRASNLREFRTHLENLERTLRVKLNAQFYEGWSFIDWADAAAQQVDTEPGELMCEFL